MGVVADEPTTALDVTIQAQILSELQRLRQESGLALIWITHDLTVVAGLADRTSVMYAGKIVEQGSVEDVLDRPLHPYTRGLISSVPGDHQGKGRFFQIPGMPPSLLHLSPGCAFQDGCPRASPACREAPRMVSPNAGRLVRCVHPLLYLGVRWRRILQSLP